jgi:hypothetical protein
MTFKKDARRGRRALPCEDEHSGTAVKPIQRFIYYAE